jgi:hypothetical protein
VTLPRPWAEAYAVRKTEWSAPEYRALSDRLIDASTKFQIAISNERFAEIVSAYHDFHEITHQLGEMNVGLMRAIERAKAAEP